MLRKFNEGVNSVYYFVLSQGKCVEDLELRTFSRFLMVNTFLFPCLLLLYWQTFSLVESRMRLTAVLYTPLEDKAFTQPRTQGFLLVLTILVPEPFLRAFDRARRGALAKSISNWHLIGHSSNTGYCSLTMFLWYPVMDLARAPRRARSNACKKGSGYENGFSQAQKPWVRG